MSQLDCMNSNFDINTIIEVNDVTDLKNLSEYLDFAIKTTIHKHIPNVTEEQEKKLAAAILKDYMNGTEDVFTRKYGIRNFVNRIGYDKIKNLLIKTLLEKDSKRIISKKQPDSYGAECASYVTCSLYHGLEQNESWIKSQIPTFIDVYIEDSYGKTSEEKTKMEQFCYGNETSTKALEKLNNKMNQREVILLAKIA